MSLGKQEEFNVNAAEKAGPVITTGFNHAGITSPGVQETVKDKH